MDTELKVGMAEGAPSLGEKARRITEALRVEQKTLRTSQVAETRTGHPRDNSEAAAAIGEFLEIASDESKARLFDIVMGTK